MNQLFTPFLIILSSACAAIIWAETLPIMPWLKRFLAKNGIWYKEGYGNLRYPRRMKPFDCYECLSFWVCLIAAYKLNYPFIHSIPMACVCVVFSIFVWKVVLKNNPI